MGDKLQGMPMDTSIVNSWDYGWDNWVYVVLSRVWTRSGLFLSKKLDFKKKLKVPEKLLSFEERMTEKEEQYLKQFRDIGGDNQID